MKRFFRILTICLALFCMSGCGSSTDNVWTATDVAMGTVVRIKLYTTGTEDLTGEILKLLHELEEQELSRRIPKSEINRINTGEQGREIAVSEALFKTLKRCQEIGVDSGGALDITMGAVVQLWDIDGFADSPKDFSPPEEKLLGQTLASCGPDKLHLSETGSAVTLEQGTVLDLGAVGKGIALDRIRQFLESSPAVSGAVISVGGSVLTYGKKPDGSAWRVAITDPSDTAKVCGYVQLEGTGCISTSGNYERYVEADGVRYHHILDPATGYPVQNGLSSVTIVSEDGFLTDALSTACYVAGAEKGMRLADRYHCQAMFVSEDGTLQMTDGFRQLFEAK